MFDLKKYINNTWILVNPYILFRIIKGFVRAIIFRKPTLRTIEIFPSMKCNITCSMCSVDKYKKAKGRELDVEEYEGIARQAAKLGAFSVAILGGEPLMYPNLYQLINIFKEKHFLVDMVSNGVLATRDRLTEMRKAGLDAICFSLDSLDREKNDAIRGKEGHFDAVQRAIDNAFEAGITPMVGTVFFPGKLEDGIAVQKFAKSRNLRVSGGQVAPVGAWEGKPTLSPQEHDQVREMLHDNPRFTLDWALSYYLDQRCPAGKEKIAISNYGDVFGCSVNPIAFGNVREEPLRNILKRMQNFSQIRKNSKVCLSAEDEEYQKKYISHLSSFEHYPVHYYQHPEMTRGKEPALYS